MKLRHLTPIIAVLLQLVPNRATAQQYFTTVLASWPAELTTTEGNGGWYCRVGNASGWTGLYQPQLINGQAYYVYPPNGNQSVISANNSYVLPGPQRTVYHYNANSDTSTSVADFANGITAKVNFRRLNAAPPSPTAATLVYTIILHTPTYSTILWQNNDLGGEPVNNGDVIGRTISVSPADFRKDCSLEVSVGSTSANADYTSYDLSIDIQRRPAINVQIRQPFTRNTFVRPYVQADQESLKWQVETMPTGTYNFEIKNRATPGLWAEGTHQTGVTETTASLKTTQHAVSVVGWPAGEYELKCFVANDTFIYPFHVVNKSPTSDSITFTNEGIWQRNGVPFVPIGIYHAVLPSSKIFDSYGLNFAPTKFLDDVIAKGFDVVHISNQTMAVATPDGLWDYKRWADVSHSKGLKVIQWILDDQNLKGNVDSMREHPALLAWNFADEPKWEAFDTNLRLANILRGHNPAELPSQYSQDRPALASGADPRHPTIIGSWNAAACNESADIADVMTSSYYPIQHSNWATSTPHFFISQLAGMNVDHGNIRSIQKLPGSPSSQPFMPTLQAFGSDNTAKAFKIPTPLEYRNIAYQGIVRGARGFLVYGYTDPDIETNPLSGKLFWLANPYSGVPTTPTITAIKNLWQAVGKVNREIKGLTSFLTKSGGGPESVSGSTAVRVLKRITNVGPPGSNAAIYVCVNLNKDSAQTIGVTLPTSAVLRSYTSNATTGVWQSSGSAIPRVSGQNYANVAIGASDVRLLRATW